MPDEPSDKEIPENIIIPRPIPIPIPIPEPVRQYSRGGDLSKIPTAAETPPANLAGILAVDTSNPFLRQLRVQQGLLKPAEVAPELLARVPITPEVLQTLQNVEAPK
jgi:hypothetical protein